MDPFPPIYPPDIHFLGVIGSYDVRKDGMGGDGHPNVTTHLKMAAKLAAAIEKEVGWKSLKAR